MTPATAGLVCMVIGGALGFVSAWLWQGQRLDAAESRLRYLTHLRSIGDRELAAEAIERGMRRLS